ncbi:IS21 family transposase, partial [Aliarcobacter cryaerophilus]|nr:IS21 family transposase [Aliarcobacter cryaerophilus]
QGIQRWILAVLRHQTFFSVDELNDAISLLLDKYNAKIVKRFSKSRFEMFLELDKPFLQSLPNERYIYKEFKEVTVSQSYHIFLEGCEYSVPYKYLGLKVFVSYSTRSVEIFYKGVKIAIHPKLHFAGTVSTLNEHMPTNHQYVNEKINPGRFLNWANNIGINSLQWVKNEFKIVTHAPNAYRKLNAVLNLAKIYGNKDLDLALEYALDNNVTATASIKSILDKKIYLQKPVNNTTTVTVELFNNHENLRGNIYE